MNGPTASIYGGPTRKHPPSGDGYELLPDPAAARETGTDDWGGDESLLQIVGLNFYNNWGVDQGWPLSRLVLEARRTFPDKEILMGETGNCHFSECYSVAQWLELLDEQLGEANRQGADLRVVTEGATLQGLPGAPGGW